MNEIYVPVLHFFENGNPFTGSWKSLRFLLTPTDQEIGVKIWRGPNCLEKSEVEAERAFPMTAEGRQALIDWLESLKEA